MQGRSVDEKIKICRRDLLEKFSSIQSVIFATVAVLVLSAVVIVTGVSMKFTNTSIFEKFIGIYAYDHPANESEY